MLTALSPFTSIHFLECVLSEDYASLCLLIVLVPVVESLRAIVLVGIILVCTLALDVVLVVHVLARLFGVTMSLDLVVLIHSLGLSKFVDLATYKASEKFLGELVRDGLACKLLGSKSTGKEWRRHAFLALVVLIKLETLKGGSTCDQLMRELGLVVVLLIVLWAIDLLMSVLGFVCTEKRVNQSPLGLS
jgi:hypothetical protein